MPGTKIKLQWELTDEDLEAINRVEFKEEGPASPERAKSFFEARLRMLMAHIRFTNERIGKAPSEP